ncbi:MAG TPA: sigma factor-like helix-turn-helix DNA-binding protein, partial [Methanosarcina sp.]|nr:sigma factor-like helix-turn-helix DNA-binding protein [Methanosarcina sp.]
MNIDKNSRAKAIMELSELGFTMKEIGEKFNISKERVRQILNKYFPYNDRRFRGASIRKQMVWDAELKEQLQAAKDKWGFIPVSQRSVEEQAQFEYFAQLRNNARQRKIPFSLKMSDIEWVKTCPETFLEIDWYSDRVSDTSPALRRFKPELGYVPGNVQLMSLKGARKYIYHNRSKSNR